MKEIKLKARAKINLTLDVIKRRDDGYHDLKMIMQSLSLYDGVLIKKTEKNSIKLKSNIDWLPSDERNIAFKAAKIMKDKFNIKQGIFIELDKRIPVAAGLAGGSTDCAAVLIGINRLFELGLTKKELMEIGVTLGADVPYCIMRGTALSEGIGDILTKLPPCPEMYVILLKPAVSVSTAHVYKNLNLDEIEERPNTEAVIKAIEDNDREGVSKGLSNVLENVTLNMYPELIDYKVRLVKKGASASLMSGSGPTIFGLFYNKEVAEKAYKEFKLEGDIKHVVLTKIYNTSKRSGHKRW